jgi:hypothetical protein
MFARVILLGGAFAASIFPTAKVQAGSVAQPEMHVIAVRQGIFRRPPTMVRADHLGGTVDVHVTLTGKPLVIVLSNFHPVTWALRVEPEVVIEKVIVGGYHKPELTGVPVGVPVERHVFMEGDLDFFFTFRENSREYERTLTKLRELTGLSPKTFHYAEQASSFLVSRELYTPWYSGDLAIDLHVLSVEQGVTPGRKAGEKPIYPREQVRVNVALEARPMVLVLASARPVTWVITKAPGARIEKVLLARSTEQNVLGLEHGVPIIHRNAFPARSSAEAAKPPRSGLVAGFSGRPAHMQWLHKDDSLKQDLALITGLKVSTFQSASKTSSFTISKESFVPWYVDPDAAEMHVVGVNRALPKKPVRVDVTRTGKPLVVVLTGHGSVDWQVQASRGVNIERVILAGQGKQRITGLPSKIPVVYRTREGHDQDYFYAYQKESAWYAETVKKLRAMTGLEVTSFQGSDSGQHFTIPATVEPAPTTETAATKQRRSGDIIVFRPGSGNDKVRDAVEGPRGQGGKPCDTGGTFDFEGVWMDRVRLSFTESALIIHYSDTDSVKIMGFDPQNAYCGGGIYNFGGASLTYRELVDLGFDLGGTASDDIIRGTSAVDRMYGYAGNDTLISYAGNDVLQGGSGNDVLDGGPDNDTYVYALGDELDRLTDSGGDDSIRFGVGISVESLVAHIAADGDSEIGRLRLLDVNKQEYAEQGIDIVLNPDRSSSIERFVFADGTQLNWEELLARTSTPAQ